MITHVHPAAGRFHANLHSSKSAETPNTESHEMCFQSEAERVTGCVSSPVCLDAGAQTHRRMQRFQTKPCPQQADLL